jgi:hypothetical protein
VLLPSPSSLHYNKQKEGSGAKNVMAALLLLPSLLHCKKKKKVMAVLLPLPSSLCCNKNKKRQRSAEGDGNIAANAFFATLQENNKKAMLPSPSSFCCNKIKKKTTK